MERPNVYVSVKDARKCDAMEESDLAERRMLVSSEQHLVVLSATEVVACKKLRAMHKVGGKMTTRVVFHDIFGSRYNWKKESINGRVPHFARWHGDAATLNSNNTSVCLTHERAVEYVARLAMQNNLVAAQLCDHSTHKAVPASGDLLSESLDPLRLAQCTHQFAVNGKGDGITTELGYRWEVLPVGPLPGKSVNVDFAVLKNGKLIMAVQVFTSAGMALERRSEVFAAHGVRAVYIDATEIIRRCSTRDWKTSTSNVVVSHHPVSINDTWICPPCTEQQVEEQKELQAVANREADRKRKRDAAEAPTAASYDALASNDTPEGKLLVGKYLKGFISLPDQKKTWCQKTHKFKANSEWRAFYINDTKYERLLNPHPKHFKIVTKNQAVIQRAGQLRGLPSCICLGKLNVDGNPVQSTNFMMFLDRPDAITAGFQLPGVSV